MFATAGAASRRKVFSTRQQTGSIGRLHLVAVALPKTPSALPLVLLVSPNTPLLAVVSRSIATVTFGPTQINGNLNVTGTLSKGGVMFKIDDPVDPANKYLSHSFVESPDMMNIYNGIAHLDARGEAWIELPQYFEALNRDFRYQLTSIGSPQPRLYIAREVHGNRFKIAGGRANAKVSWQVTGIPQDAGKCPPHSQRREQAAG